MKNNNKREREIKRDTERDTERRYREKIDGR